MQQVDFIDDEKSNHLSQGNVSTLSSNNVPLLRCGNNDLSLV